eukprot:CFRG7207T1
MLNTMNITSEDDEGVGLLGLSFDVIHAICVHLDPVDLCELSKTCQAFRKLSQMDSVWMSMAKAHFTHWRFPTITAQTFPFSASAVVYSDGWEPVNPDKLPAKELYKQLQRPTRVKYIDEMDVAWSEDSHHYEYIEIPGSMSSRVLRVKHMSHLWAKGVFPSVRPGYYQPIWRIQTTNQIRICEPVLIEAHPDSMNEISYDDAVCGLIPAEEDSVMVVIEDLSTIPRGVWSELKLPAIHVHRTEDICTIFRNTTDSWKCGIVFDCIRLVKMKADGTSNSVRCSESERHTTAEARKSETHSESNKNCESRLATLFSTSM